MEHLKLLIVDDVEDNRLILKAICRKMEGFEIREAKDGVEAIEAADEWRPNIILMDIMMPRLDGFEASKIIKERYPETIIMAITAVIDPQMEANMESIGVVAYIHKPIDKDIIRFKLQSFAALLRMKSGERKSLSSKAAVNPFSADIRYFKTVFEITDSDAMMDFGMWILSRCEGKILVSCAMVDNAIELFYELMRHGSRDANPLKIVIEESFDDIFVTMQFEKTIQLQPKGVTLVRDFGDQCIVRENTASVWLRMRDQSTSLEQKNKPVTSKPSVLNAPITPPTPASRPVETPLAIIEPLVAAPVVSKETRTLRADEQDLLRQSYVHKTTAAEYVAEIGGDVLDEIRELASLDEEWQEKLTMIEKDPSAESIRIFTDGVLGVYVHAINGLFEFTALAYALSALGGVLKEHSAKLIADPSTLKKTLMLLEHLGHDLGSWRSHIFEVQDAQDIHYLDSSFFSSCMQIEGMVSDKAVVSAEDDNEMEFF